MKPRTRVRLAVILALAAIASLAFGSWATVAGAKTYPTNVSIHYDKKSNTFDGHLGTTKACQSDRDVTVYRSQPGPDTVVGASNTGNDNSWGPVPVPGPGKYYARVSPRTTPGYNPKHCAAGRSRTITVKPSH